MVQKIASVKMVVARAAQGKECDVGLAGKRGCHLQPRVPDTLDKALYSVIGPLFLPE